MKKLSQVLFVSASVFFLIACQSMKLQSYSSDQYHFEYPSTYSIELSAQDTPVLTVRGEEGRIEIFKMEDFDGNRIHGFSSSGLEEFEAQLVPKEKLEKGDYTFWIFYLADDQDTSLELRAIFNSFASQ